MHRKLRCTTCTKPISGRRRLGRRSTKRMLQLIIQSTCINTYYIVDAVWAVHIQRQHLTDWSALPCGRIKLLFVADDMNHILVRVYIQLSLTFQCLWSALNSGCRGVEEPIILNVDDNKIRVGSVASKRAGLTTPIFYPILTYTKYPGHPAN